MRTKLGGLLIAVLCAVCFAFACGGGDDETYTEKKLIEESIDVYCNRLNECDKEAFDNKYSSLGDCVKAKKEAADSTPIGDDVFEYGPVCPEGYTFDPDMAKKTLDCLRSISCVTWSQSNACDEYEDKICVEEEGEDAPVCDPANGDADCDHTEYCAEVDVTNENGFPTGDVAYNCLPRDTCSYTAQDCPIGWYCSEDGYCFKEKKPRDDTAPDVDVSNKTCAEEDCSGHGECFEKDGGVDCVCEQYWQDMTGECDYCFASDPNDC